MRVGTFLMELENSPPISVPLTESEAANKRARLACFVSQADTLAQFGVEHESYRIAPDYNFTVPPHEGQLFYERFPWGMTGERWRELAKATLKELFPAEVGVQNGASRDAAWPS